MASNGAPLASGDADTKTSLEKIKRQLASGSGRNLLQGPLLKRSETWGRGVIGGRNTGNDLSSPIWANEIASRSVSLTNKGYCLMDTRKFGTSLLWSFGGQSGVKETIEFFMANKATFFDLISPNFQNVLFWIDIRSKMEYILALKLKALKIKLKEWSKTAQGNLGIQKQNVLSQLVELDRLQEQRELNEDEIASRLVLDMELKI
ncbi:hypothetical protein H5410_028085 [Solanum commersonii]|uniref:Uncharacterized protein n=1 Tax=Solanum commersonii TaxID=4109 RepID=A0A9J5Z127_SOLCO|nr:hypothetical protein H5410_028085 [Solanum commersonii]